MTESNFVVLQAKGSWWRFSDPENVISTNTPDQVPLALQRLETAVGEEGLYAAGYLSYEASAAFALKTYPPQLGAPPLLWFGLYRQPEQIAPPSSHAGTDYEVGQWHSSVDRDTYVRAIDRIKSHIAAGYTYQVNYTFHQRASFSGDPWALFLSMSRSQQADYTAYVDIGSHAICSASPELFYQQHGEWLMSKPMKGTACRGFTLAEDRANMNWLHNSDKNRAENVMIVDMIRNDMGKVAEIGTVHVPTLFEVERYPTLLQMTSTVRARTTAPFGKVMAAMFPCASITGAPKVSTMEIINELEKQPRGVYTGAVGYITPHGESQFNVAIRTAVVDRARRQVEYGVGSGITWDSDAAAEYEECRIKTHVLTQQRPTFDLLESLLWTPEDGYFLLSLHLGRLKDSAEYFCIDLDLVRTLDQLQQAATALKEPSKVRVLIDSNGRTKVETYSLPNKNEDNPVRVKLATSAIDSTSIWLYHKTTHRKIYEDARIDHPDCDDVILWNERGEITEATTANIVLDMAGQLLTPPVTSGLLAGVYRQHLLAAELIVEQPLTIGDLESAERIWLINSVRKCRQVILMQP